METDKKLTAREDWCGYQRKWYEANKARILEKKRRRYAVERAHKTNRYAMTLQVSHEWRVANNYGRKWREANPTYHRDYNRKRRAELKVLNSPASHRRSLDQRA